MPLGLSRTVANVALYLRIRISFMPSCYYYAVRWSWKPLLQFLQCIQHKTQQEFRAVGNEQSGMENYVSLKATRDIMIRYIFFKVFLEIAKTHFMTSLKRVIKLRG